MAERIFRGFSFLGRRIFSRILSPELFSSSLWGKILQDNPRENAPKFIQQKSPTHVCRGAVPTNTIMDKIITLLIQIRSRALRDAPLPQQTSWQIEALKQQQDAKMKGQEVTGSAMHGLFTGPAEGNPSHLPAMLDASVRRCKVSTHHS